MATKYARSGGGNWSADATWSTTSGGSADTTKPVNGDTARFDANSGNVTVDAGSYCTTLTMTSYGGTLTVSNPLNINGSITLGGAITGASYIYWYGTGTLTSNGVTIGCILGLGDNSKTHTLADNAVVSEYLWSYTITKATLNGYTLSCNGLYLQSNAYIDGTTEIILTGGTWHTDGAYNVYNNLTINGSVTISGNVYYRTGTLTYQSGVVSFVSSGKINYTAAAYATASSAITLKVAGGETVAVAGITKDNNGDVLGSCDCYLFKDNGDNTAVYIGHQVSNASTGAYSFSTYAGSTYFVVAFKDGSPAVMDVTDRTLTAA